MPPTSAPATSSSTAAAGAASIGSLDVIGLVAAGPGSRSTRRGAGSRSRSRAGRRIGEVEFILTPLWGLAETDLLEGDADGAVARCDEALGSRIETGERALFIPFVVTGARAFLAARRPDDAERWVARARRPPRRLGAGAGPALEPRRRARPPAAGSLSAAREALERAVRGWDERGRVWEATWARLDLAGCLMRMNRYADAAASLIAAVRATAERLGSAPLLARADELARASRGRGPSTSRGGR